MPYSELTNWGGSLDDFTAPKISCAALSPQREREIERSNARSAAASTAGGYADGDDENADAEKSEVDFAFVRNVKASVKQRPVVASMQKRVVPRRKDKDKKEMHKEIVVTRYSPSGSGSRSNAGPTGRDNVPSYNDEAGPSGTPAQTHISPNASPVKRTYAGPRKIRGPSSQSELKQTVFSAPGYNGFPPSRIVPQAHIEDSHYSDSDEDNTGDLLSLEAVPSRVPSSSKDVMKYGPPNGSSTYRPIKKLFCSRDSSPLPRSNGEYSKNPFYASLSEVINGKRRQTLEDAEILEKPKQKLKQHHTTSPQYRSQPKPTQLPRRSTTPRSSFYGVIITPRHLPVPPEMYKSVDEHIAEEEAEMRANSKRREEKHKERDCKRESRRKHGKGKWGPINRPSRKEQAMKEAIYVSSGSEAPIAGPSKLAPPSCAYALNKQPDSDAEQIASIVVDSSSGDDYEPPKPETRNPPIQVYGASESEQGLVKRLRKRRRTEVILSSEGPSESDSTLLVENPNTHRRSPPSLSPDLLQTPPRRCPDLPAEQRALESAPDVNARPDLDEGGEDLSLNSDTKAGKENSSLLGEGSIMSSSNSQKDDLTPASGLSEIVTNARPPAPSSPKDTVHPRSPTLCLTGTLSHLTSLSPTSRSTTLAFQEEPPPNHALDASDAEMALQKMNAESKAKHVPVLQPQDETSRELADKEEEERSESESENESDEEDDVCHHCRSRNVYAKMKCTKIKRRGGVCHLHFCHRCVVVYLPNIEFDPYSTSFVCPTCDGTCNCVSCLRKRGLEPEPQARGVRRWDRLGATLLLSHQETRRRERQEIRRAAGLPDLPKDSKPSKVRRRCRREDKIEDKRRVDIGEEAEAWIRQQSAGRRKVRAFIGAWQDAWGPTPFHVHEMSGIDYDVHAVNGTGKGKEKAVDPDVRLFIGDEKALHRPFVRANDVVSVSSSPKKQPRRKRKQSIAEVIYVTPAEIPYRKKRRLTNKITTPEFTLNHRDSTSSKATTTIYSTPDDFLGLEHALKNSDPSVHSGLANDPMLGVMNGPFSSNGLDGDMYAPDWDSIGTKPLASHGPTFSDPDFAYDGTYDLFATTTGLDRYDPALNYNIGDTAFAPPNQSEKGDANLPIKDADFARLIEPTLIEQSAESKTHGQSRAFDSEPDPMRFLTAHGRETALLSIPMIYGVPSSTGLSLLDLERTVRQSLNVLSDRSQSCTSV